jgi:chromatin segregation and condensation protein Rec8/ScpA/Scc1 (kleisin family)
VRAAAAWLEERLDGERERWFRVGPAPVLPARAPAEVPAQDPAQLGAAIRRLAVEPPAPSLRHMGTFPPVSQFLSRFRAVLSRRRRFLFDREVARLSRVEQAVAFLALLELRKAGEVRITQLAPFEPIAVDAA